MAKEKAQNQQPGFDNAGMIARNADCVITFRVTGAKNPEAACEALWNRMPKGEHARYFDVNGPRIIDGEIVYSIYTVWRGDDQERAYCAELQQMTGGKVHSTFVPVPPSPEPIPGIDAPLVLVKAVA